MSQSASRTRYTNLNSGNDLVKRNVFNCLLKKAREVAVVTLVGRLFDARALAAVTRSGHRWFGVAF